MRNMLDGTASRPLLGALINLHAPLEILTQSIHSTCLGILGGPCRSFPPDVSSEHCAAEAATRGWQGRWACVGVWSISTGGKTANFAFPWAVGRTSQGLPLGFDSGLFAQTLMLRLWYPGHSIPLSWYSPLSAVMAKWGSGKITLRWEVIVPHPGGPIWSQ